MFRGTNVLEEMEQRLDAVRRDLMGLVEPGRLAGWRAPAVDIVDEGNRYVVIADLPGVKRKDVKLEVDENRVRLHAHIRKDSKEDGENFLRRERHAASYDGSFALPEEVSPDGVEAKMEDGVLRVVIPKTAPESRKSRLIDVS